MNMCIMFFKLSSVLLYILMNAQGGFCSNITDSDTSKARVVVGNHLVGGQIFSEADSTNHITFQLVRPDNQCSDGSQNSRVDREKRLAPIVGALIPTITSFAGKLLRPLISDIAHRPGVSKYKDNLLQHFLPHALKGTPLADTQLEHALESALRQWKYSVALSTLKSQEKDLDTSNYLPEEATIFKSFKIPEHNAMHRITWQIHDQYTTSVDKLIQERLLSLNHISASFVSTVIEQLRLTLQSEHRNQSQSSSNLAVKINKVQTSLNEQKGSLNVIFFF